VEVLQSKRATAKAQSAKRNFVVDSDAAPSIDTAFEHTAPHVDDRQDDGPRTGRASNGQSG